MAPVALMHNLKHNKVLHEHNVILTVRTAETPRVRDDDRVRIEPINADFKRVTHHLRLHGEPERAQGAAASAASRG